MSTVTVCNSPDFVSLTVRLFNSSPNDVANQRVTVPLTKRLLMFLISLILRKCLSLCRQGFQVNLYNLRGLH